MAMCYKCPNCGAMLDPGEKCECMNEPDKEISHKEEKAKPTVRWAVEVFNISH